MFIKKPAAIPYSEITKKTDYLNRRNFIAAAGMAGVGIAAGKLVPELISPEIAHAGTKLEYKKSELSTHGEELTPLKDISTYNNFYEFGTNKDDPSKEAK